MTAPTSREELLVAGLEALLAALHAGDPNRELYVRVGDLIREAKALGSVAQSTRGDLAERLMTAAFSDELPQALRFHLREASIALSAPSQASREPIRFIDARLKDLAEANALYGKDQRLGAPDKISRNDREISWLKDLRSLILTASPLPSTQCATPAPHAEVRESTIEKCAKIADPWQGFWIDENSSDADRAVVEVRQEIAKTIRALALPQSTERDAQVTRPERGTPT